MSEPADTPATETPAQDLLSRPSEELTTPELVVATAMSVGRLQEQASPELKAAIDKVVEQLVELAGRALVPVSLADFTAPRLKSKRERF